MSQVTFPREKIRILLLENIHPLAALRFQSAGYTVETASGALDEDALAERLPGVHVLGLRSKTQITAGALEHADRLLAVGAFCIGVNQIDLGACARRGAAVFNAPYSNTRSVVELAIAEIIALNRGLFDRSVDLHGGRWTKSAKDALAERLPGVHVLGIRSKTQITAGALEHADRLLAVGAFCIGVNQIDLGACARRGAAVFNAPYSNTRSVVELAIAEIIALNRGLFDRSVDLHGGRWTKSAKDAFEIRGKKLGIIGYGAIGSQLSVIAEALGLEVYYYDLTEKLSLGNVRRCRSLDELLGVADIVSLHVDGRKDNTVMIGAAQFAAMKDRVVFLNLSRGHVVDLEALREAVLSGKVLGAAVDVFPEEPHANGQLFASPLQGLPNVILTPHIGGSTEEAQEAIADFAADRLLGFLERGDTSFSVNLPNVQLPEVRGAHRLLHIHENRPGLMAGINRVLALHGANILAQHLRTNEEVGYVVTDIDRNDAPEVAAALRELPGTIRFRTLY